MDPGLATLAGQVMIQQPPPALRPGTGASPSNTCRGARALRRSYKWTLWSAEPTAISWLHPGLYFTQHTLAFMSISSTLFCWLVDQTCKQGGAMLSVRETLNQHTVCQLKGGSILRQQCLAGSAIWQPAGLG